MAAINKTTSRTEILVNNIRIGGKAPTAIYKGGTEVKKVQKGSTVVYEKGSITYTLYRSSDVAGTTATLSSTTIQIQSYKGSSTPVGVSASVISGSCSIGNITSSGTTYSIPVTFNGGANTSTSAKTFKIRITQGTSGQTADITITQAARVFYLSLRKLGFRFSGQFPSQGFDLGVSTVVMGQNGTHYEDFWGVDSGTTVNGGVGYNWIDEARVSNIDDNGNNTGAGNYVYYNNASQNGSPANVFSWGPQFKNGDAFSVAFKFGGTFAGTSAYQGYTWYFHVKQFSNNYIKPATSSKYWEVGVQPCYIGIDTVFQNINADATVDLIVDFNWSWSNYWWNNL